MTDEHPSPSPASFRAAGLSPAPYETPLLCGIEPVDLLAQVCDGHGERLSAHQRQCPHCRLTLADYQRLWAPFVELAAEPVRAPRGLVERALSYVRETASGLGPVLLPLDERPDAPPPVGIDTPASAVPGRSWVGARVVVLSARLAAQGVPGVRLALSHLDVVPGAARSAPIDAVKEGDPTSRRRVTVLEVTVAADYGQDLHDLGRRIRWEVTHRVEALIGVRPASVSVHVDDVFPARP